LPTNPSHRGWRSSASAPSRSRAEKVTRRRSPDRASSATPRSSTDPKPRPRTVLRRKLSRREVGSSSAPEIVARIPKCAPAAPTRSRIDAAEDDPQVRRQKSGTALATASDAAAQRAAEWAGKRPPALDDQPVPSPCQRAARRLESAAESTPPRPTAPTNAGQAASPGSRRSSRRSNKRRSRSPVRRTSSSSGRSTRKTSLSRPRRRSNGSNIRLAQRPQPAHCHSLGAQPDGGRYSYCSASSTFNRAACRPVDGSQNPHDDRGHDEVDELQIRHRKTIPWLERACVTTAQGRSRHHPERSAHQAVTMLS